MIKYAYSKYEEFIQNHKQDTDHIYESKTGEIYIIDETGLNLDKTFNFDILSNCNILDFKVNGYNDILKLTDIMTLCLF